MPTDDVLAGFTREQLLELKDQIDLALVSCTICGNEGAARYSYRQTGRGGRREGILLLCLPCVSKHREPSTQSRGESVQAAEQ